ASIQKLRFVNGCIAVDGHTARKPVLTKFLQTLDDLIAAGLACREINRRAVDRYGEARALPAFPSEDSARRISGGELWLRPGHAGREGAQSLCCPCCPPIVRRRRRPVLTPPHRGGAGQRLRRHAQLDAVQE